MEQQKGDRHSTRSVSSSEFRPRDLESSSRTLCIAREDARANYLLHLFSLVPALHAKGTNLFTALLASVDPPYRWLGRGSWHGMWRYDTRVDASHWRSEWQGGHPSRRAGLSSSWVNAVAASRVQAVAHDICFREAQSGSGQREGDRRRRRRVSRESTSNLELERGHPDSYTPPGRTPCNRCHRLRFIVTRD